MDRITQGPIVNEHLETGISGIFACGNVLHVHDLVDFVSEEAKNAGRYAAHYIKAVKKEQTEEIVIRGGRGVRYTVPQKFQIENGEETLLIRFRVDNVYKDKVLGIFADDREIRHIKKRMLAPGEMEEVRIKREELLALKGCKELVLALE